MASIDMNICIKCSGCIDICPELALSLREDGAIISNAEICTSCGDCVQFCPVDAVRIGEND